MRAVPRVLQRRALAGRNPGAGEGPEAGRDAIDGLLALRELLHARSSPPHRLERLACKLHRLAVAGDCDHLSERQRPAADPDGHVLSLRQFRPARVLERSAAAPYPPSAALPQGLITRPAIEERSLASWPPELDDPAVADHHPVVPLGRLHRNDAPHHVREHPLRLTLEGIAPASTPGRAQPKKRSCRQ